MRAYAIKLARQQGMICPLCLQPLDLKEKGGLVLDHDHRTGLIRGVLHRACNGAEGKVANAAGRWGARSMEYSAIIPFLRRLVEYLERAPLNVLYPFHKTSDEKRMDRNKAAREARAKRKAQLALKDKS